MNDDPILNAIKVRFERFILFFIFSALISIALWIWVLLGWFDFDFLSAWQLTQEAYSSSADKSIMLILRGCCVVGGLTTLLTFLIAALWWRKSGDVHRRGARFVDARDGRS